MGKGKRAWIYCSIDAPEDTHGALKEQFKSLMDYAEQMCFETCLLYTSPSPRDCS